MCDFVLFFFFSSRRRHTRCLSDWSSDVCSSDLNPVRRRIARVPPCPGDPAYDGDDDRNRRDVETRGPCWNVPEAREIPEEPDAQVPDEDATRRTQNSFRVRHPIQESVRRRYRRKHSHYHEEE